ncbi:hypothetical protein B0H13DRAFT_2351000 [Mycena leptocephala]|nr:hypothetical protein B0H13DRAFT_2351000 [Mycena leptocephala]
MRTKAGHQIAIWETLSPGFLIFRFPIYCITRAVAYNIVGPALPQALRVLRYPSPGNKDGSSIDPLTLATTCPEERDASSLITAKEKMCLQEDSELVEALENIYSSMFKDRTLKMSVLTWKECCRFRRSMYHILPPFTYLSLSHN